VIQLEAVCNPWLGEKLEASPHWFRLYPDRIYNEAKPWDGQCYYRASPADGAPLF
jgi:hypothetical protein